MNTIATDWKDELKLLHLRHLERNYPDAFRLSGGYTQKVKPYTDKTANGLTRCIIDWITYNGGDAQRINSTVPKWLPDAVATTHRYKIGELSEDSYIDFLMTVCRANDLSLEENVSRVNEYEF